MQPKLTSFIFVIAIFFMQYSCTNSSAADFTESDKENLKRTHNSLTKIVRENPGGFDYETFVNAHYADDAVMMLPNMPAAKGRANILETMRNVPFKFSKFDAQDTYVEGSGNIAMIEGVYDMTLQFNNGTEVNDKGKYLEVWRKNEKGEWKCIRDISNSDQPLNQ